MSARLLCAVLAAGCISGCASQLSLRTPDFNLKGARVAFMPAMVALYDLEADDSLTFDDARSKRARVQVNSCLRYIGAPMNIRLADLQEVAATPLNSDAFYTRMDKVTRAIIADQGRRQLPEWTLGEADAFRSWVPVLRADYVVFIVFRGAYPTEERRRETQGAALVGFAAGGAIGGLLAGALYSAGGQVNTREGALVVVDLNRDRIVRFQTLGFDELDSEHIPMKLWELLESLDLGQSPPPPPAASNDFSFLGAPRTAF